MGIGATLSGWLDGTVAMFSPVAGARRLAARKALAVYGSYKGADSGRLRHSWTPGADSANREIERGLKRLRERARDLNRNDGTAAGLTSTLVANIVGAGSHPQARVDAGVLGISDEAAETINRAMEAAWRRWAENADVTGQLSFAACQALAQRQEIESGEFLAALKVIDGELRVMLIEPDRLDLTLNRAREEATDDGRGNRTEAKNEIRMGVEYDAIGRVVAYWITPQHPGDTRARGDNQPQRFERLDEWRASILHGFRVERPGQSRGVPWFAPVLDLFKDFSEYMEAERVAARVAACFSVFIRKTDAYLASQSAISETEPGTNGKPVEDLEPGIIQYLNAGEDITSFEPARPGTTFDMFVMRLLRIMAAALDVPYELIAKDWSNSNYSNMRGALLEARRVFKIHQQRLQRSFCQPIYERVIELAVLRGEISAPGFYQNRAAYLRTRWIHPGWNWVDPEKEITASIKAIEAGLSSEEDECAANGKDAEEIAEARAREVRRHRASGTVNPKELATAVELLARAGYKVDAGEIGQALGLTVEKAEPTGQVTDIERGRQVA